LLAVPLRHSFPFLAIGADGLSLVNGFLK
jgi:hypothetical protein